MEEMSFYIGHKPINANPMTRQEYNDFRGWTLPADENGDDEGYLVEYTCVSWLPKDVFETDYQTNGGACQSV